MRADRWLPVRTVLGVLAVLSLFAAGSWLAADFAPERSVSVEVHADAGPLAGAGSAAGAATQDGLLGLRVVPSRVSFGDLEPGSTSAPVALEATNAGRVALRLSLAASDLTGPGGVIPASRMAATQAAGSAGAPLAGPLALDPLPPGGKVVVWLTLTAPSGKEGHVPAGAYDGSLELRGLEVRP